MWLPLRPKSRAAWLNSRLRLILNYNTVWWFGIFFIFQYLGSNSPNWFQYIFQRGSNHQPETNRIGILLDQCLPFSTQTRLGSYNETVELEFEGTLIVILSVSSMLFPSCHRCNRWLRWDGWDPFAMRSWSQPSMSSSPWIQALMGLDSWLRWT